MSNKFNEMIRDSARGSLVLIFGQIITTIISALTIIWIARVIGSTSYGLYTIALVPVGIAMLIQDFGMNSAMMRFCAMYRHDGRKNELKSVVMTGLVFSVATSLVISGVLYFFSGVIASVFLKRPEVDLLVKATALSVLGNGGLLTTIQAIFVGYEMMGLRSVTQILYSVVRAVLGVALILVGLGAFGAIVSYTTSIMISGLVATFLLFLFVRFGRNDEGISWRTLKTLLRYGIPMSISTLLGGILSQLYSSLMVIYVATDLIGNYGAASNFGVLVQFFTVPIAMSLFPLFSKFKRDDPQLKNIYKLSVKFTTIVTVPVVFVIIVLSSPLSRLVFGTDYPYTALYLSLYIITFAFEGLGGLSLSNVISGIGEVGVILRTNILVFMVGSILAFILIPRYQILGLLVTMIIAPRAGWVYQTIWTKRNIGLTIDWGSTSRIYATALSAFAASYLIIDLPNLHGWVALTIGGSVYLLVYTAGLPLTKALKRVDLEQLKTIANTMGPLAGVLKSILSILGHLTKA
jgi:O-antigen/teichoic acid export membrane protein